MLGSPARRGPFGGHTSACFDVPVGDILNIIRLRQNCCDDNTGYYRYVAAT